MEPITFVHFDNKKAVLIYVPATAATEGEQMVEAAKILQREVLYRRTKKTHASDHGNTGV
jgi:hypothetical protein